ncbi:recombinase family protein [Priestia aryabhattai]|uniref:recombinase family protein n=1 Tax=Priestia aryabhattai TaxID=412384 RepID=UPI0028812514|nr:recombinase family protein [Priestia aryabhattai]MDT0149997.1 recombinase family protein [Priestia aryabhattai]MDT0155567.1 recombinase family protein [Priestia aryabhattai]
MTVYGYARVSTKGQNLSRQIKALNEAGCETILKDKITGTKRERPALDELFATVKEGDLVIIQDLTRISRSTQDLLNIVNELDAKGVGLKSLKESWLDTSSQSPQSRLMLTIFAGLAQFERDITSERTKEGLEVAKENGKHIGRPKTKNEKVEHAITLWKQGTNIKDIEKLAGVSKTSLYRKLKERGLK